MPTYEYKCTNDGSTFDIWQEVGSPAPPCPDCGAPTKKVFAPPRVIFKGAGFYVTDARAEASKAAEGGGKTKKENDKSASESASTEPTSSDAKNDKAESKSETKTETPKADATKSES